MPETLGLHKRPPFVLTKAAVNSSDVHFLWSPRAAAEPPCVEPADSHCVLRADHSPPHSREADKKPSPAALTFTLGQAPHREMRDEQPANEGARKVGRMSTGEFARKSRLSPKALRLYDDLGLLPPAYVDARSSYRVPFSD